MCAEGSLEVKLPTIWTEVGRAREEKKKKDQRRERVRGKKMQVREKVEKSRFTVFFPLVWTTVGSCDVEKVHAVVARSTFRSQNVQNTPFSDHFWKLRCRKSARRCGAKHISKSKCTKHTMLGPPFQVEMSKKCTPLWRSTFRSQNVQNTNLRVLQQFQKRCQAWDIGRGYAKMHFPWQGQYKRHVYQRC